MKKVIFALFSASAFAMSFTACSSGGAAKGIDRANLDEKTSPKDDFYQYACGGWMEANPLTDEYSRYGSFDQLGELNRQQVKDLIEGIDRTAAEPGSNAQKIADLYFLGMDSVTLNAQGAAPVQADLQVINALTKDNLAAGLASITGNSAFFNTYVGADLKDANINTMYVDQGGLGLGDRDYYLVKGGDEERVLAAYKTYLQTIAKLAGYNEEQALALAENAIAIETALAQASMSREELRDVQSQYNPMSIKAMQMPSINLQGYFAAKGLADIDTVIVGQPKFVAAVDSIIKSTDIQAIRDYVAAGYLASAAPYLSDDFVAADFELSKALSGVKEQKPRWKRAQAVPDGILGEALGELYVEKYFPASSKEKMLTLVGNLKVALGQHIDELDWMSPETKAKAHEKLDAFVVKIGYPDKWRDYSDLTIDPNLSYWDNIKAASEFNEAYNLNDYGKPVDRTRWYMSPQTVNAYYNPTTNEICFPAGILQKPFFDPEADDALNYGAIGVVIGHEMTHGFDDQGCQFDKDGNMANWWTEEDAAAFKAKTQKLVDQFNNIIVHEESGTHANGQFTLGENIADQGGLRVAYTAYHNSLDGKPGEDIDGFTPDQRFYLAYAGVWAGNIRDEEILRRTKIDPHSLGKWRVNGTLKNLQPFYDAFSITEGDTMFLPEAERVIIW